MGNKYSGVRQKVLARRDLKFEKELDFLKKELQELKMSEADKKMISLKSCTQLIKDLNCKKITSKQIVLICCERTASIGRNLNLFTQTNFIWAIEKAVECDHLRANLGKKNWTFECGEKMNLEKYFPPLFGIPISVKDAFDMKGFMSTLGCLSRVEQKQEDSPIIDCFKKSGMIPFVRTNVPPLLGNYETTNSLWGRSLSPWDRERTPGGSSGGEAGLIASGCSFLGVGSDSGGSIRIPSQFCGIYGLKSSSRRISELYNTSADDSLSCPIPLCIGPLARTSEDLALFMKISTTPEFYAEKSDPYTKIIEYQQKQYIQVKEGKKLRIGFIKRLDCSQICPTSERALNEALTHLQSLGHELIEVKIPEEKQMIIDFVKQMSSTGGKSLRHALRGETPIPQQKGFFTAVQMNGPAHFLASKIMQLLMPRVNEYVLQHARPLNTLEYQTLIGRINGYKAKWAKYWMENKLDLVVAPGAGFPAMRHGKTDNVGITVSYLFLWNLLDMVAGMLPVTTVREQEQHYQSVFNDMESKALRENIAGSAGLPIGVQVIGLPYSQQKVLGLMAALENKIKFAQNHPRPNL